MHFDDSNSIDLIKVPLLKTRTSHWLSILLSLVPAVFLLGVLTSHYLGFSIPIIGDIYDWVGRLDQQYGDSSWLNWIIRILLVGGPALIVFINLLSILHVIYVRTSKELICTIKLKIVNLLWLGVGLLIFLLFIGYLVVENS